MLFTINKVGNNAPLILVHAGSGTAWDYKALRPYFLDRPIYGINNPYFGQAERAFKSVEEMAYYYLQLIRKRGLVEPFYLGGWSFGAVVAFEMAKQMEIQNRVVNKVLLIDMHNPTELKNYHPTHEDIKKSLKYMGIEPMHKGYSFIRFEIEHNTKLGLNYVGERGHFQLELLKAEKPYDGLRFPVTPYNGWEKLTSLPIRVQTIPCDHFQLFDEPYVSILAEKLRNCFS